MSRYEIGSEVGRGGVAVVHRAVRLLADHRPQPVIIKRLQPEHASNQITRTRLDLEAAIGLTLAHPHIVKTYDYDSIGPDRGIVMEHVDGVSLFELVQGRTLPADLVCLILVDVAMALAHVHDAGILHRDISPGNILLSRKGDVKLTDFGVARLVAMPTTSDYFKGTAAYASPEAIQGKKLEPSADLYSLAAVVYELVTGAPPYGHGRADVIAHRQDPASGYELKPLPDDVPGELRFVLEDLLQPADERQLRTADLLVEFCAAVFDFDHVASKRQLAALVDETLKQAAAGERPAPQPQPRRRWPVGTIITAGLILVLIGGLAGIWYARNSSSTRSMDAGETAAGVETAPLPPFRVTPERPASPAAAGPKRHTERTDDGPDQESSEPRWQSVPPASEPPPWETR